MLTVVIATHNGSSTLPRTLDAFCNLDEPIGGWKLVIVDNASTDNSSTIAKNYANRLPLTLIQTQKRGKNVALNIGLDYIDGDLVVFTDDDVVPDADWLIVSRKTADDHREFDIFGGTIYPIWPFCPEEWITKYVNLGATYAVTPEYLKEGPISVTTIWGPNMAVRSAIFHQGHRFNEAVGPQAGQYIMGSEVEFGVRIERIGHRGWFNPKSRVGHIIRSEQLERKWIIRRQFRLGRHMFHQESKEFDEKWKLIAGAPRWKYKQLLLYSIKSIWNAITFDSESKFCADLERSYLLGYLYEAMRVSK